jgi:hypothetical protein
LIVVDDLHNPSEKEGMCRKQWGNIVDCTPKSPFHEEGMYRKRLGGIVVSIPKKTFLQE